MDLGRKRILVLGGFGLVGRAVIQRMMREDAVPSRQHEHLHAEKRKAAHPSHIVITSLGKSEAESAVQDFETQYKHHGTTAFEPFWGNLFVREEWKDLQRESILKDPEKRDLLINDILGELTEEVLTSNTLYNAIEWARPDAIVDCINTSTAFAYQDLFTMGQRVRASVKNKETDSTELVERLLASLYIPQLIRHVQILHRALMDFNVRGYVKVGTSGTGGMGLNIPFTHSEERPSRMLLAKSSLAGAHSLLLFLMARTPRTAEIVKEIKPTATIGWKEISYGPIRKGGKPIALEDAPVESAEELGSKLKLHQPAKPSGKVLESVYIDTGENGIFSKGEFETISSLGQMEMVTPEEIAENVYRELVGASTGKDVIAALDASSMGPTYRAGYLRESALRMLTELEAEKETSSIAFEMLGPPRLAKLLFEAHLLKRIAKNFNGVAKIDAKELSEQAQSELEKDSNLRSQMISIGIPILFADGKRFLRGSHIKIPVERTGKHSLELTNELRDHWANEGWVDLRETNMQSWKERFYAIREQAERHGNTTGSEADHSPAFWNNFETIDEGKLAAWIFANEEGGERVKR